MIMATKFTEFLALLESDIRPDILEIKSGTSIRWDIRQVNSSTGIQPDIGNLKKSLLSQRISGAFLGIFPRGKKEKARYDRNFDITEKVSRISAY
jgi:hypothetical protein